MKHIVDQQETSSILTLTDWIEAYTASGIVLCLSAIGGLILAGGILRLMDFGIANGWVLP